MIKEVPFLIDRSNKGLLLNSQQLNTITYLLEQLELYHMPTLNHSLNVAEFSMRLAMELGLEEKYVETVFIGGLLHDIGKLTIPLHLLNRKNNSILSDMEYRLLRNHGAEGARIIRMAGLPEILALFANQHSIGMNRHTKDPDLIRSQHWLNPIIAVSDTVCSSLDATRTYQDKMKIVEVFSSLSRKSAEGRVPKALLDATGTIMCQMYPELAKPGLSQVKWIGMNGKQ
ncbi:MAG: hypothetical protein US11_C0001G0089 [Candidatus Roizmanbacteria bacterium GW2011_GWA2_36_23]|uniref:Uncharacterized protein n=1 Tax=Candidatus Roizmanbacteria bacterium GW2011_GWA2_36_23 TaxID=1618480 RepID=A0A0G0EM09_9BACT|nr:MAG: hypothetical protein US11_C0001G0089 [Candidatus Roizmanbacteria bacterium GW2011_GWA2_36_23]